jgi:hypothetical protein
LAAYLGEDIDGARIAAAGLSRDVFGRQSTGL